MVGLDKSPFAYIGRPRRTCQCDDTQVACVAACGEQRRPRTSQYHAATPATPAWLAPTRHRGHAILNRQDILLAVGVVAIATAVLLHDPDLDAGDCATDAAEIVLRVGRHDLLVEVAANDRARRCGLAFRDDLPAGRGMLFVFPDTAVREFWMRDTRIPLTLAFIDDGRHITEVVELSPAMGDQLTASGQPARYALEANPEWFARHGIEVGDRLSFELPSDVAIE